MYSNTGHNTLGYNNSPIEPLGHVNKRGNHLKNKKDILCLNVRFICIEARQKFREDPSTLT